MKNVVNYWKPAYWVIGLALISGILPVLLWRGVSGWQASVPVQRALSLGEQATLVTAVFGFKLVYMILTLGLLALIWTEKSPTFQALKGFLVTFWLGEFFCWINILFFVEESLAFEYLHSLFMVICLGFLSYSLMEVLDHELLHFSDPHKRCALAGVCKECVKATPGPCLLRRLFRWMIPLFAGIAVMPLVAQPLDYSIRTQVFGLPRLLTHLLPIQWYELRFSPIAALLLMAGSWIALVWRGQTERGLTIAKILLSAALGYLGFAFMRLIFAFFYREGLVWFDFWEEFTELTLLLGVLVMLWLFRPQRFARPWVAFRQLFM